jgi:hypothetical protein
MQYPSYVCMVWLLTQLSIRIPRSIHPLHPIMFELFTELCGRLLTLLFYHLLVSRCHSRCALAVRGAILGCLATGAGFSRQINSDRSVRKGALITESRCRKEENRSLQLLELQKTQSKETDINSCTKHNPYWTENTNVFGFYFLLSRWPTLPRLQPHTMAFIIPFATSNCGISGSLINW